MASNVREPFKDLFAIQERMNRLFETALVEPAYGADSDAVGSWTPAADVFETDNDLFICCELPGLDEKAIEISLNEGVLTLHGERKLDRDTETERFHRIERSYGSFARRFSLPVGVQQEGISASYKNGVITVRLPKRPESRPHRISVRAG
jgi:HSP20 family protein